MADVNVPVLGRMPKGAVYATVIGGGIVLFFVWRNYKNASGSQSPGIDPATGYPAGSAQDQAALAAQSGQSSQIDPMTGYPVGSAADEQALAAAGYSGYSAGYPAGDMYTGYGSPAALGPETNAQWAQQVQQTLTAIGYDPETVAGAVGAYLSQIPLSSNQAQIVQVAIAEDGPPPQGSYAIVQQPSSPGAGPAGGTATVTVLNVIGQAAGAAHNAIAAAGLTPIADPSQKPSDKVTSTSPAAGTQVPEGSKVLITATPAGGGTATVTVPNTAGMPAGEAHNVLAAAGLVPAAPAAQKPDMRVSYTTPRAGTRVAKGTRVVINTSGYVS